MIHVSDLESTELVKESKARIFLKDIPGSIFFYSSLIFNMSDQNYISKAKGRFTAMNYADLYADGIDQIQTHAPETWTDHNLHDPGITILELLSYAITDLGHRTNYAMRDILAENFDKLSPYRHSDYNIQQILPCNPVTLKDWRKLLIDLPAVRNAWVRMATPTTPELYNNFPKDTDNDEGELTFTTSAPDGFEQTKIDIQGLYEVFVELEPVKNLVGDLNSPSIFSQITVNQSGVLKQHRVEVICPRWSEVHRIWQTDWTINGITISNFTTSTDGTHYIAKLGVGSSTGAILPLRVEIYLSPGLEAGDDESIVIAAIEGLLTDNGNTGPVSIFHEKVKITAFQIRKIKQYLLEHRNLTEDFLKVDVICYEEIVLHGDVIVRQGTDIDKLAAVICFLEDQFLRPLIKFRSLSEMRELGYTIDQLFSGPLLKNGFINDDDLDGPLLLHEYLKDKGIRSRIREAHGSTNDDETVIYTSDLIRIIMCLKEELGVIAIRNFSISSYIDNVLQSEQQKECVLISNDNYCKPKLDVIKSASTLQFKTESLTTVGEDETIAVDLDKFRAYYEALKAGNTQGLSDEELANISDQLAPQRGRNRHIKQYSSIQEDFPITYGLQHGGLPPDVTAARKAKARQLKAYLLFFEQFLANYQAQLAHVKELFSIDRRVEQTYFSQSLYNVPDAYLLLKSFVDNHVADIDQYDLISADWTLFKEDLSNHYRVKIQEWIEAPSLYYDRRNRFLDFLLARLGEDMNDYAAIRHFVDQNNVEQALINCKIAILENLPLISRDRGRAFNYCAQSSIGQQSSWEAYNQSGYKHRLTQLMALKDEVEVYHELDTDGIEEFRFRFKKANGDIKLSSAQHYHSHELDLMNEHIRTIKMLGIDNSNYELKTAVDGRFYFNIIDSTGDVLARSIHYFNTAQERNDEILDVITFLTTIPRFHFLEHVLLRPKSSNDGLLQTKEVHLTAIKDPYSFGCSIIFPAFLSPFDQTPFRAYAEKICYLETPAHVLAEVYWVEDQNAFEEFEAAYKEWLRLIAEPAPVDNTAYNNWISDIRNALAVLIEKLDTIRITP